MKTKLIALLAVLLFSAGANAQNAPANEQPAKKFLLPTSAGEAIRSMWRNI